MAKLSLTDLMPAEAMLELSEFPGRKFKLRKFTLADKIWCQRRFGGPEQINAVFERQDIPAICEIGHHLLDAEGKKEFPTFEDFAARVVGAKDEGAIYRALLETIGLSQPVLEKIVAATEEKPADPNAESPPSK